MIRFLKERLSIAERANGDGRWAVHLPGILRDYNNALIKGTDVRRRDVDQNNYLELLGKLYRSEEPSMLINMTEAYRAPSSLARYLWRYKIGDRVLLARRVDYALKGKHYFEKPSVSGSFGPKVYTVTACRTKLNADLFICPVYALDGGLTGLFYESELTPALFDPHHRSKPQAAGQVPASSRRRSGRKRAAVAAPPALYPPDEEAPGRRRRSRRRPAP